MRLCSWNMQKTIKFSLTINHLIKHHTFALMCCRFKFSRYEVKHSKTMYKRSAFVGLSPSKILCFRIALRTAAVIWGMFRPSIWLIQLILCCCLVFNPRSILKLEATNSTEIIETFAEHKIIELNSLNLKSENKSIHFHLKQSNSDQSRCTVIVSNISHNVCAQIHTLLRLIYCSLQLSYSNLTTIINRYLQLLIC